MITLIIKTFWRVPPTRWDITALRDQSRKQCAQITSSMLRTLILRGVRRGAGRKGGPKPIRGQPSPLLLCHSLLLARVRKMLQVTDT